MSEAKVVVVHAPQSKVIVGNGLGPAQVIVSRPQAKVVVGNGLGPARIIVSR